MPSPVFAGGKKTNAEFIGQIKLPNIIGHISGMPENKKINPPVIVSEGINKKSKYKPDNNPPDHISPLKIKPLSYQTEPPGIIGQEFISNKKT